jgi:hypothetical protein
MGDVFYMAWRSCEVRELDCIPGFEYCSGNAGGLIRDHRYRTDPDTEMAMPD